MCRTFPKDTRKHQKSSAKPMKRRFLQYCSIIMIMMFISNITLANFYAPSTKTSQENSYTQKQESSFWAKFVTSLASEIEKIEEKTEQEDNENAKLFINSSHFSLLYSSLKFQKNLFHSQITEWLTCRFPNLKSKISKSITLLLHRFRL